MRFSVKCAFPHLGKRDATSRKSAFCVCPLTEKRILQPAGHGKAHSACAASRKSALCTSDLTEKRTLHAGSHVKAHSGRSGSRKSALCTSDLTEKRSLQLRRDRKTKSAFSKQKTHPTCERSRTLHRRGHATTRLPTHRTPVPQPLRPEVHV